MIDLPDTILALDVGEKRVGVATVSMVARLPRPLTTLTNDENFWTGLQKLVDEEGAGAFVVGLPRGLEGQSTQQTEYARAFITQLQQKFTLPVFEQDEALTSQKAEAELGSRGDYSKANVDSLAATYILEDFLTDHPKSDRV
jgi:putative Holliday junction resolvase